MEKQEQIDEEFEILKKMELRIIKNFIAKMPKVYRKRNMNFTIVGDILTAMTSKDGMTSRCEKCKELGLDPYGYTID